MARPRKESHPITVRLEQKIFDSLNDYCDKSGQSKTVAIERALQMYIGDYNSYSKGKPVANKK